MHPEYQQATLTTVVFLGMLLSSSIWGILADKYGRRTILVVSIRDRIASLKSQTTFDSYYIATKREHSWVKCVCIWILEDSHLWFFMLVL